METTTLTWHRFKYEAPKEGSVILVRGELNGNGHTSEYYVFIVENGIYLSGETGKDIETNESFDGYLFTHWAYIPEPKIAKRC